MRARYCRTISRDVIRFCSSAARMSAMLASTTENVGAVGRRLFCAAATPAAPADSASERNRVRAVFMASREKLALPDENGEARTRLLHSSPLWLDRRANGPGLLLTRPDAGAERSACRPESFGPNALGLVPKLHERIGGRLDERRRSADVRERALARRPGDLAEQLGVDAPPIAAPPVGPLARQRERNGDPLARGELCQLFFINDL